MELCMYTITKSRLIQNNDKNDKNYVKRFWQKYFTYFLSQNRLTTTVKRQKRQEQI